MNNERIEEYIFRYDELTDKEREEILDSLKESLSNLDSYKILDCYFKYSNRKYLKGKSDSILNLLKEEINKKIDNLSLIKVIDLYIDLFNRTILVSDTLMASKNILAVLSYNLQDDEYIKREMDKNNVSKEEYVSKLKGDLDKNILVIEGYNKTYNYLDTLQDDILIYIESKLDKIENQDKYYLIQNINKRFSDSSLKLLKLKDNLDNIKNIDRNELLSTLEYSELKNKIIIYESFRDTLLKEKDGND